MNNYQMKRKQQEINYKLTMLNDTRERLKQELKDIDTNISILVKQRSQVATGGLNEVI